MTAGAASVPPTLQAWLAKEYAARLNKVGYVSFYWFRALTEQGVVVSFRFTKGADPARFLDYVARESLTNVTGPFKTRKAALAE